MRKFLIDTYPAMELRLNRYKREALTQEFAQCAAAVEECIRFTRKHMGAGSCQIP